ncbi:MAG: hypothetical protein ACYCYE_10415 [Clostridia bacterium]
MKQLVYVNDLIKWNGNSGPELIERVLWVDPDNIIAYLIDINADEGFPVLRCIKEINDALVSNEAMRIENYPFVRLVKGEELNEKERDIRDRAWAIISEMVDLVNEPLIYKREGRGPLVSKAVEKYGVTYATIYKYLRRYWQRGKTINALLPDYFNSGGKGKRKTPGSKKLGRPRKNADIAGAGVNVDEATKKIFRVAYKKYYDTPKENYLTVAYDTLSAE